MQFLVFSNLCKLFNIVQTFLIVTAQFLFPEVYTLLLEVGVWLTINGEWWLAGWDRCLMTFSWRPIFLVCLVCLDFPSLYCSFLRLLLKLHQTPCVLWLFPFLWPRQYAFQENKTSVSFVHFYYPVVQTYAQDRYSLKSFTKEVYILVKNDARIHRKLNYKFQASLS